MGRKRKSLEGKGREMKGILEEKKCKGGNWKGKVRKGAREEKENKRLGK